MENPDRLDEFIRGATRLPVLPKVTIRLLNTLDSPDSSSKDIAAVIEAEPVLSARLLKLANSSFYGQRGRISTIRGAVVVLGSKTIRSLALTLWTHTLRSTVRSAQEASLLAPLLAHGLATGVASRMLAERTRPKLGEDAFMAGLLHDIGRVALVVQMGMAYRTQILDPAQQEGMPLHEKESAILGFDHRALGAALLRAWALPAFLVTVAERHHDPGIVPEDAYYVAATALADSLATRLGFNLVPGLSRPGPEGIAAFFGLTDKEVVAGFLALCLSGIDTISAVLEKTR